MQELHITNKVLENEVAHQGKIVLRYTINYPSFSSDNIEYTNFLKQINDFYHNKAISLYDYCENELKQIAINQASITSAPVELMYSYTISHNENGILSLYTDKYEFLGGAHGTTIRTANTWDLKNKKEIKLNDIKLDTNFILNEIRKQISNDPSKYYSDALTLLPNVFNENNFYLTPNGIVIFFQEYEIAPYVSGIVEFSIPYSTICSKNNSPRYYTKNYTCFYS